MTTIRKIFQVVLVLTTFITTVMAQPPSGGRGPGFDPGEMVAREKQNLYKELTDLTADQKMLLDVIYDEYSQSVTELRDEVRETRNFEAMRPKMEALRKEKDGLVKDVLNEDQYAIYEEQMKAGRERRRPPDQQSPDQRPPREENIN